MPLGSFSLERKGDPIRPPTLLGLPCTCETSHLCETRRALCRKCNLKKESTWWMTSDCNVRIGFDPKWPVNCTPWPVHSTLTSAQCTEHFDQCTVLLPLHTTQYTLTSAQNTLTSAQYNYQCTVHFDQCTMKCTPTAPDQPFHLRLPICTNLQSHPDWKLKVGKCYCLCEILCQFWH